MSNTGKPEERAFELAVRQHYRTNVDIQRLSDSLDAGRLVAPRPSDFLIVFTDTLQHRFPLCYVEVKSTSNSKSWGFKKSIRESQWIGMRRAAVLKREYLVALAVKQDWYLIPSTYLLKALAEGRASLTQTELQEFLWNACKGNLHALPRLYD
jgi:hypothetical protein